MGPGARKAVWEVRLGEPRVWSQSPANPRHHEYREPHKDALALFRGPWEGLPMSGPRCQQVSVLGEPEPP